MPSSVACLASSAEWRLICAGWRRTDPFFDTLARAAADRYVTTSITAWEFARGKLRGDPLYRDVLLGGWLPSGAHCSISDADRVSCWRCSLRPNGSSAQDRRRQASRLPRFDRMVGIELRPHRARLARTGARIGCGHHRIRRADHFGRRLPRRSVVRRAAHDAARRSGCVAGDAVGALEPGGVILVREADASAGWRFQAVRIRQSVDGADLWRLASAAGIPHGQRMARVFFAARPRGGGCTGERGHSLCESSLPPHGAAGRVCSHSPTRTICVSGRPSRSKVPPNHNAHPTGVPSLSRDVVGCTIANVRP